MARPNMKSVRLSDEALAIVEASQGNGFNDKFERLIIECKKMLPTRQAQADAIDRKIEQKKKELERLQEMESQVRRMVIDLEVIANLIPQINNTMINVSQKIDQARPAADEVEIQRFEKAFQNFTS